MIAGVLLKIPSVYSTTLLFSDLFSSLYSSELVKFEMMKALLPYFDSNIPDNENHTALDLAQKSGHEIKQEALVNYKASGSEAGYVRK